MKQISIIIFLTIFGSSYLFSQKATIFGKITDEDGAPLIAATIEGGNEGTTTDALGNYTIELGAGEHELIFSYVGYNEEKRTVYLSQSERRELNIVLNQGTELLQTATITSGKFEKPLGEVTVSLEVLKPSLLENTNTIQVDEVLEKVPSVTVIDGQASIRAGSGYSYGAGSRVLLLVDDLPALQGDAGFPNWDFVPVENIAQIEILKGASSALYGSSALNGIINIRTAYPSSEPYTKVSTFATFYDNPSDLNKKWWSDTTSTPLKSGIQFAHRQQFNKLDVVVGGYYLYNESFRKGSFSRYGRVNTNFRYRFSDNLSAGVNLNYQQGKRANFFLWANDTTGAYQPLPNSITENANKKFIIDPFVTYYRGNTKHKLLGRFYNINNDQSNELNDQSLKSNFIYGEYQFQQNFEEAELVLTSGVVTSQISVNAALYGDSLYTARNSALYVNLDKKFFDKLNVSLGVRYERNAISSPNVDDEENKPVMRLGANYQTGKATYWRASYGQGYRYPTIAEKYISTSLGTISIFQNDTLSSETGWSAEFGIKQGFKVGKFKGYFDAALFWMEYDNMMEFVFGQYGATFGDIGFASQNIGNTRVIGGEVSMVGTGKLFGLPTNILAGYTYSDPRYRNFENVDTTLNSLGNVNVLKYRFRHVFKLDYEVKIKKFSLGLALLGYSHMENIDAIFEFDFAVPGIRSFREAHNSGTLVTNLRAAYEPNKKLKLSVLVNNLMNNEYALRPALLDAPRNFSVRVDYRIQ